MSRTLCLVDGISFLQVQHCMMTDKHIFVENLVYEYVYLCVFVYREQSLFVDFCFRGFFAHGFIITCLF